MFPSKGCSRRAALGLAFAVLYGFGAAACGNGKAAQDNFDIKDASDPSATFYLVRHAEKELTGDDPALSAAGYARADALAAVLSGVKFDGIYSTDTRRTRDTAAPTLEMTDLNLTLYDGRALSEFAQELLTVSGNYLIVGHSNTTPQLADALGGEGGEPIVEADEYDRLYVLTRTGDTTITELRGYP